LEKAMLTFHILGALLAFLFIAPLMFGGDQARER
jgi:hypothetical protein